MIDFLRRSLAVGMLLLAVIGLLPLVPLAFGYKTAKVTNDQSATYYPATVTSSGGAPTPLIYCEQAAPTSGATLNLSRSKTYTAQYWFLCTNNWGTDVTVSILLIDSGASNLTMQAGSSTGTIPAGTSRCIKSTMITTANKSDSGNILYQATATATDMTATIQFSGIFQIAGADSTQCTGTKAP